MNDKRFLTLLTPQETAEVLGLSTATLAAWRCLARYNLAFIRIGRRVRYRQEDVLAFVEARTVGAEPAKAGR